MAFDERLAGIFRESQVVLGARRMGGLVFVDESECTPEAVRECIVLAMNFVTQLPPKR